MNRFHKTVLISGMNLFNRWQYEFHIYMTTVRFIFFFFFLTNIQSTYTECVLSVIPHPRLSLNSALCYSQYTNITDTFWQHHNWRVRHLQYSFTKNIPSDIHGMYPRSSKGQANNTPELAHKTMSMTLYHLTITSQIARPSDHVVGNKPSTHLSGTHVTHTNTES